MKNVRMFFIDLPFLLATWALLLIVVRFLIATDGINDGLYLLGVVIFVRVMLQIVFRFNSKIESVRGNYQVTAQLKAAQRDWIPLVQKVCVRNNGLIMRMPPIDDLWVNCKFEQSQDVTTFIKFLVENNIELFAEVPE